MEQARLIHAPTKVSRLEAIYALPSLADALVFRNQYQPTNIIYEVQPTDPSTQPTIGDYALAAAPYPQRYSTPCSTTPVDTGLIRRSRSKCCSQAPCA